MPHKGVNSKNKTKFNWKKIAVITLLIISGVLMGNIMFCTMYPSNYSQNDLDNRIPLRLLPTPPPEILGIMRTNVFLTDTPIAMKLTCIIRVDSPNKAEYSQKNEYRLTRNAIVHIKETPVMKYEEFNDYSASLDGNSIDLGIIEINGTKYYVMPDFNLTSTNEVRTLLVSYTAEYYPVTCPQFVKIPWVFNDNYAQMSSFWLPTVPVEKGSNSDTCKLSVDFNLPYKKVLIEQSGWFDVFVNPKTGLEYSNQNQTVTAQGFEYPIDQTATREGGSYIFQTVFSEQNQSNQPTMTVVPDFFGAPLLLISFLASPFLIMLAGWLDEKRSCRSSESQSKTEGFLSHLIKILKSPYTLPVAVATFIGITTYPNFLIFLSFIYEITNPVVLAIIIIFPAIFYFIYAQFKKPL